MRIHRYYSGIACLLCLTFSASGNAQDRHIQKVAWSSSSAAVQKKEAMSAEEKLVRAAYEN